jgi:hypothetical protein
MGVFIIGAAVMLLCAGIARTQDTIFAQLGAVVDLGGELA